MVAMQVTFLHSMIIPLRLPDEQLTSCVVTDNIWYWVACSSEGVKVAGRRALLGCVNPGCGDDDPQVFSSNKIDTQFWCYDDMRSGRRSMAK